MTLITPAYRQEQIRLHKEDPTYATIGHKWAYLVVGIAVIEGCDSILDYGCGKSTLKNAIWKDQSTSAVISGSWFSEYDPAVEGKDVITRECYGLVVCTDVMEHIEPECLVDVIKDLARLTDKLLFLVISTKFDKGRQLSDGRNSHLIVKDGPWWESKFIAQGFKIKRTWNTGVKEWVALLEKVDGWFR